MNSAESLASPPESAVRSLRLFVFALFFVFGGVTRPRASRRRCATH
jgi:hypothetical protein